MSWRVKDWDALYERGEKKIRKMEYVLVPNKHDGYGFRCLMAEPDGMALLGAWLLMLQIASKANPRGYLVRASGEPHTPVSIGKMTGGDAAVISRAMEVLACDEVGWIELADDYLALGLRSPKESTEEDRKRAHGRMDRMLKSGRVCTPAGRLTERPTVCQWCDKAPVRLPARGMPGILGHHLTGYGSREHDSTVIFVCRTCHSAFENNKVTTRMVLDRYGTDWIPHLPPPDIPHDMPPDTLTDARAQRLDLTRPDQRGQDLTTTRPDADPYQPFDKIEELKSPPKRSSSFPSLPIPKAVRNALLTTERIDWMRQALQGYMQRDGSVYLPKPPDDDIILRCLNAVGDTDLETIGDTLKTLRSNGQAPGKPGGPEAYTWFPKVLENIFQADAAQS